MDFRAQKSAHMEQKVQLVRSKVRVIFWSPLGRGSMVRSMHWGAHTRIHIPQLTQVSGW